MNILHISTATSWRGGEQQLSYLIDALKPYEVNQTLLCVNNSELSKRVSLANIIELPKPVFLGIQWVKEIYKICNDKKIDIIQIHESKSQTFAVLSSVFYNIPPIIVTRRVIFPVKGILSKFKYRHNSIKKIVCISTAVKNEMLNVVSKEKLIKIPSAVNENDFKNNKTTFSFFKTNKIKIGYVAALTKEKDHETFIKTAKEVLKKRNDVVFYIIGDGNQKDFLKDYVKTLGIENHIYFTGFVKEIKSVILELDLLLFTSKSEGLGTTVIDFFLAKKPVVATDSKGIRDLVINKETGILCKIEDVEKLSNGVLEILENTMLKEKLISQAYLLAKKEYSIESLGENYYTLYKETIK